MLYLGGKYVFMIESVPGLDSEAHTKLEGSTKVKGVPSPGPDAERARPAPLPALLGAAAKASRKVIITAGHADLRWHLWIALALLGRLDLALAVYAVYFPLRAIGGVVTKAVAHA
jgi:hypothetical protein